MGRKIRSYRGVEVDMESLVEANGTQQAVGNINVNARGDVLDERGRVVQTKEERAREYNKNVQKSVIKSSILDDIDELPEIKPDPRLSKKSTTSKSSGKSAEKADTKALDDQDFEPNTNGSKKE